MNLDTIRDALANLVNMEIRTIVGDFSEENGKIVPGHDAKAIVTRINLLDGDITTAFSTDFLEEPLESVREFHNQKEEQGHAIVQANIAALRELSRLVMELNKADDK